MNWFFFQDAVLRPRTALVPALLAVAALPIPAHALDGCKVLLCIAGPWQTIPECIPDVREALRRAARGKPWPTCAMAGAGSNTASVNFTSPSTACPPQYLDVVKDECGRVLSSNCRMAGSVDIGMGGQLLMQVWFTDGTWTSTWYSDQARTMFGAWIDPRYDTDYFAWLATQPTPGTESPTCGAELS